MSVSTTLSPGAEAILLLCGHFTNSRDEPKPLNITEYNSLARWLANYDLQLGDLLEAYGSIDEVEGLDLDWSRIGKLLDRGPALALAVERWFNHGLWIITRADDDYPPRLFAGLRHSSPPILYGIGDRRLLTGHDRGLAIVGSREVDEEGAAFTERVARKAAEDNVTIISGGARGVDATAMGAVLEAGGAAVGVLADNLNRAAVSAEFRDAIRDQRLTLISPFTPEAGFNVGNAMARNKLIYTLADWALVVSSGNGQGGTWAGATENLRNGWRPLFVRTGPATPEGNLQLIESGGIALDQPMIDSDRPLWSLLDSLITEELASLASKIEIGFDAEAAPQPDDPVFQAVWPVIEERLATPLKLRELLGQLGPSVKQGQLKAWLEEAERRSLVERPKPTDPYQLTDQSDPDGPFQLLMFEDEG